MSKKMQPGVHYTLEFIQRLNDAKKKEEKKPLSNGVTQILAQRTQNTKTETGKQEEAVPLQQERVVIFSARSGRWKRTLMMEKPKRKKK